MLTIGRWCCAGWRGMRRGMAEPRNPRSLGILFALLPIGGAITAGFLGEPVIGLVAGLGAALVLAILFWLADRRR